ncbi:MAG: hypothetical protein AAB495_00390 [Patescibacteria group bacterium]
MKNFFLKFLAGIVALILLQVLIARYLTPLPEITLINKNLADGARVLFFGDSAVWHHSIGDKDPATLPEMLERETGIRVGNQGHPAYHLGVYAAEVDYLAHASVKPDAVVIPIQLRSFSPEWDMRPVNQFEKELFFLTDRTRFISYFYKPLAILRAINVNTVSYTQFLETPVYSGDTKVGTVNDFEALNKNKAATFDNIKGDFVYKYMYRLQPNHRKLAALDRLLATAKDAGIKTYIYIAPIDYETGEKYVGKEFTATAKANADYICELLKERGAPCLNLALGLPSKAFDYPSYPNEHMNELGRKYVVSELVKFYFKK